MRELAIALAALAAAALPLPVAGQAFGGRAPTLYELVHSHDRVAACMVERSGGEVRLRVLESSGGDLQGEIVLDASLQVPADCTSVALGELLLEGRHALLFLDREEGIVCRACGLSPIPGREDDFLEEGEDGVERHRGPAPGREVCGGECARIPLATWRPKSAAGVLSFSRRELLDLWFDRTVLCAGASGRCRECGTALTPPELPAHEEECEGSVDPDGLDLPPARGGEEWLAGLGPGDAVPATVERLRLSGAARTSFEELAKGLAEAVRAQARRLSSGEVARAAERIRSSGEYTGLDAIRGKVAEYVASRARTTRGGGRDMAWVRLDFDLEPGRYLPLADELEAALRRLDALPELAALRQSARARDAAFEALEEYLIVDPVAEARAAHAEPWFSRFLGPDAGAPALWFGLGDMELEEFLAGVEYDVERARGMRATVEEPCRTAIGQLGSDDWKAREKAMERLVAFGTPALPLLEEAARTGDPEVRRRAEVLVRRIRLAAADWEGIWEALVERSPWSDTRAFAGATIRFQLDEAGNPSARWIVHGSGEPVIGDDVYAVELDGLAVRVGERSFTFDRLSRALLDDGCVEHRLLPGRPWEGAGTLREAIWTMMEDGLPIPTERLLLALRDANAEVRAYAAAAAGRSRDDEAPDRLRELLADPDPRVRREAAEALGRTGEPADRDRIRPLLEDADPHVREHARAGLEALDRAGR